MKLKMYNASNSKVSKVGKSTLTIRLKSSLLCISKTAAKMIGLEDGDGIEIYQDEDSPEDIFIHKSSSPDAFRLRGKSGSKSFNCARVARLILGISKNGSDTPSVSFPVCGSLQYNGMDYWLIATQSPNLK